MKFFLALLPLILACSHNIYTPPSRPMPLTSPQTLGEGETVARASGSVSSDLFGPSLAAGTGGVRRGLGNRLELDADLSYAKVMETATAGTSRSIGMLRVGGKYRPTESANLALVAGLGGGYSPAAGPYASTDVGAVLGYDNRYLIPFLSIGAFGSVPLSPNEVDVTGPEDSQQFLDTPEPTLGVTLGAGIKIPVNRLALVMGMASTQIWDSDSNDGFMAFGCGIETSF